MSATVRTPIIRDYSDLETELFAWDPNETTRRADAFIRATLRPGKSAKRTVFSLTPPMPEMPGSYTRQGGETVVIRANDAALVLARIRAA